MADDPDFKGIYFDGESHFYIDGSTTRNKRLLCLAYDDVNNKYYGRWKICGVRKIGEVIYDEFEI